MHMLLAILTIFPLHGEESRIIEVLESLRADVASNAECLESLITTASGEGGLICYTERWRSQEALECHVGSDLYCWVFEAMELSRLPPRIEFLEVRDVGGLEMIASVRAQRT